MNSVTKNSKLIQLCEKADICILTFRERARDKIKISRINGIFHSLFLTGLDYTLGIFARIIWVSLNLFARPGYTSRGKSILFSLSLSPSRSISPSIFVIDTEILSDIALLCCSIEISKFPRYGCKDKRARCCYRINSAHARMCVCVYLRTMGKINSHRRNFEDVFVDITRIDRKHALSFEQPLSVSYNNIIV